MNTIRKGFHGGELGQVFTCTNCGKRTRRVDDIYQSEDLCYSCTIKTYAENDHLNPTAPHTHVGEMPNLENCPGCKSYYENEMKRYKDELKSRRKAQKSITPVAESPYASIMGDYKKYSKEELAALVVSLAMLRFEENESAVKEFAKEEIKNLRNQKLV